MTHLTHNEEIKEKIMKEIDFLSDHWVKGDDRPPFSFGGWREEVTESLLKIFLSLHSTHIGEWLLSELPLTEEDEVFIENRSEDKDVQIEYGILLERNRLRSLAQRLIDEKI